MDIHRCPNSQTFQFWLLSLMQVIVNSNLEDLIIEVPALSLAVNNKINNEWKIPLGMSHALDWENKKNSVVTKKLPNC